eukprot:gene7896-9715_t
MFTSTSGSFRIFRSTNRFLYKTQNILYNNRKLYYSTLKIFSWGCGIDGKLGNGKNLGFEAYPFNLPSLTINSKDEDQIKSIECGHYHSMLLMKSGKVYSFGWTSFAGGDTFESETNFKPLEPMVVDSLLKYPIKSLAGGRRHTLAVSRDHQVFSFGVGSEMQLGTESTKHEPFPVNIRVLSELGNVVKVSAGWGHSLALTDKGEIYSWGWTKDGQSGIIQSESPLSKPTKINSDQLFVNIYSGSDFNLALTDKGELYSWGCNEMGQLGIGSSNNNCIINPTKIDINNLELISKLPLNESSKLISCGFSHSLIVNDKGELYSFGWNGNGQLGIGNKNDQSIPIKVNYFSDVIGEKVVQVAAGRAHSGCITESGRLFMWGNSLKGKLGNGSTKNDELLPIEILDFDDDQDDDNSTENKKVRLISCGFDHTIIQLEYL